MNLKNLPTPAMVVDLDILEKNIKNFHSLAKDNNKEIWPMTKTHKSKEIMRMQLDAGAKGLLCGTIDECEAAAQIGAQNIMYAYPASDEISIDRIISLNNKVDNFIIRLDSHKQMEKLNDKLEKPLKYSVKVDVGLHRFGVDPSDIVSFVKEAKTYNNLEFVGISTHPGHVYGASSPEEVEKFVDDEVQIMQKARKDLEDAGISVEFVSVGSTPTYKGAIGAEGIDIYHPGNYIFFDAIQISLGSATIEDCAFSVLASIASNPRDGQYIMDAGSKCLGLDKGAHGVASVSGHGLIKGHEGALVDGLSEEVGKIMASQGEFEIGDRIQIIPNHTCSSANGTDYIYGYRNGKIEKTIEVDIRSNSNKFF